MTLRVRILLASSLLIVLPIAILAVGIRREMARRLTAEFTSRVDALAAVIEADLDAQSGSIADRLAALKIEILNDNRFRLAAVGGRAEERSYLLDYAGRAMRVAGLSMLQIQDSTFAVVSSGHFRNEYGHADLLPSMLGEPSEPAITLARWPEGNFLALARVDSLRLGGKAFTLGGGIALDRALLSRLSRGQDLAVSLLMPGAVISSDSTMERILGDIWRSAERAESARKLQERDYVVKTSREFRMTMSTGDGPSPARNVHPGAAVIVTHPRAPLAKLLRDLDRWLALVLAATAAGTLVLAAWLSAWISRPIRALARKTEAIDLDNLDADFSSDRADEVGALARFLGSMTARLRASVGALRDAERRATLGDLARQVNHDIRNGVTPIQNVVRHLGQVARENPADASRVLIERQATIESSLAYLEELAANYARLTPATRREPVDVNAVVRQVVPADAAAGVARGAMVGAAASAAAGIRLDLAAELPAVLADPTGLRRVVENLVRNARDSIDGAAGTVTIATAAAVGSGGDASVVLSVRDTGRGMSPGEVDRIFEHFYTTKAGGIGLGLSIVKRLVSDFEGSVRVESEPGRGTTFAVTLPAMPRARHDAGRNDAPPTDPPRTPAR